MDISEAKRLVHPRARRRRVGRGTGSRRGKLCGRGRDGAKSRSGWSSRGITGGGISMWRRLPKVGFSNQPFKRDRTVVNIASLQRFVEGATVGPEELRAAGLVKQIEKGGVKVLGNGELTRKLTVRAHAFSASATAKIEAAGGTAEIIPAPKKPVRHKMGQGKNSRRPRPRTEG